MQIEEYLSQGQWEGQDQQIVTIWIALLKDIFSFHYFIY